MQVWRLITHHEEPETMLRWARTSQCLAIGWGDIGDLRTYRNWKEISRAIRKFYPTLQNSGSGGRCLWGFLREMSLGDLVILGTGARRGAVVQVTGDYEYIVPRQPAPIRDYQHQRSGKLLDVDPDDLWTRAGAKATGGYTKRWTLMKCERDVNEL